MYIKTHFSLFYILFFLACESEKKAAILHYKGVWQRYNSTDTICPLVDCELDLQIFENDSFEYIYTDAPQSICADIACTGAYYTHEGLLIKPNTSKIPTIRIKLPKCNPTDFILDIDPLLEDLIKFCPDTSVWNKSSLCLDTSLQAIQLGCIPLRKVLE